MIVCESQNKCSPLPSLCQNPPKRNSFTHSTLTVGLTARPAAPVPPGIARRHARQRLALFFFVSPNNFFIWIAPRRCDLAGSCTPVRPQFESV